MYGHLESVLDEVRAGIGRVDEENAGDPEATARLAAARPEAPAPAPAGAAKPAPAEGVGGAEQPALLETAPKATATTQQAAAATAGTAPEGGGEAGGADASERVEQAGAKEEPAKQGAGSAKEATDRA